MNPSARNQTLSKGGTLYTSKAGRYSLRYPRSWVAEDSEDCTTFSDPENGVGLCKYQPMKLLLTRIRKTSWSSSFLTTKSPLTKRNWHMRRMRGDAPQGTATRKVLGSREFGSSVRVIAS